MRLPWISRVTAVLASTLLASGARPAHATEPDPGFESFYMYLGEHPTEAQPGWHNNTQGITHDDDYWYITQTGLLFKVPVTHDLSHSFADPEIIYTGIGFDLDGYDHYGDLTEQDGYLFIPVTGDNDPIIAVYRADDLSFVGMDFLVDEGGNPVNAGWCAVDPEGYLYTSINHPWWIMQFELDWDALASGVVSLTVTSNRFLLRDETGAQVQLFHMQGGVFSPSGGELYLCNGFMIGSGCDSEWDDEDWMREVGGIHVFALDGTTNWHRVGKSTNGGGYFNYEFHPGGVTCEEPEGLTIWDLDDGRAPNIAGQLHVILTDQNLFADEVYLKHYTQKILVDRAHSGSEDGTPGTPFNTVIEAASLAWDGSMIEIENGSYPESMTVNARTRLTAVGGPVTIGN